MTAAPMADDSQDSLRWGKTLAVVLALHLVAAVIASQWQANRPPAPPPENAISLDLAPIPAASAPAPAAAAAAPAAAPQPAEQPKPVAVQKPQPQPVVQPAVPLPLLARPVPVAAPAAVAAAAPSSSAASAGATGTAEGSAGAGLAEAGTSSQQAGGHGRSGGGGDMAALWRGRVLAHLDRHKRYPPAAKMMKREGRVHLKLMVDRRGQVLDVGLHRGAGFPPFDKEAMDTVRRANPLPPPPSEIAGETIPLQVPIGFYLPGVG